MKSYEAMELAIGKNAIEHARKLHLSASLVRKWKEPTTDYTDSGAFNPLDRIESVIETSLSLKASPEESFAPIQYLAEKFNLIVIPVPEAACQLEDLSQELLKTVEEFGHLAAEASAAMADGIITKSEFARINKEGWGLIRQTCAFLTKAKDHITHKIHVRTGGIS